MSNQKRKRSARSGGAACSTEFRRGAELAADCARSYNGCTSHPYDLGDCILAKLNLLPKKRIRSNDKLTGGNDRQKETHE